jgi:hypothetical protein
MCPTLDLIGEEKIVSQNWYMVLGTFVVYYESRNQGGEGQRENMSH